MSYKCEICQEKVPHGSKRKVHRVMRHNGDIEKEIPVCASCDAGLRSGYSLERMRKLVGPKTDLPEALRHIPKSSEAPPPNIENEVA